VAFFSNQFFVYRYVRYRELELVIDLGNLCSPTLLIYALCFGFDIIIFGVNRCQVVVVFLPKLILLTFR